jgi:site-specific recombinase XerD
MLEKKRIAEIEQGKGTSLSKMDFGRKGFGTTSQEFLETRKSEISEATYQLERNLLMPLRKFFDNSTLIRIRSEHIAAYQRARRQTGISGRTLNMEIGVLRQMMKKAKIWSIVADDVRLDKESTRPIAKVLTEEQKKLRN